MHINAIHPSSPNSQSAEPEDDSLRQNFFATRIQASWKGYRVRKGLAGGSARKFKNGNERTSIEEKSAKIIQSTWKKFKTRKELNKNKNDSSEKTYKN